MSANLLPATSATVTPYNSYVSGLSDNSGNNTFDALPDLQTFFDKAWLAAEQVYVDAKDSLNDVYLIYIQTITDQATLKDNIEGIIRNYSGDLAAYNAVSNEFTTFFQEAPNQALEYLVKKNLSELKPNDTAKAIQLIASVRAEAKLPKKKLTKEDTTAIIKLLNACYVYFEDCSKSDYNINLSALLKSTNPDFPSDKLILTTVKLDESIYESLKPIEESIDDIKSIIERLEYYYYALLDDKVKAYSVCKEKFACCDQYPYNNYSMKDFMIDFNKLKNKFLELKDNSHMQKNNIQKLQANFKALKKPSTKGKTGNTSGGTSVLSISSSDIKLKANKLSSITLHQSLDTVKATTPKISAGAIDSIDALWPYMEKVAETQLMRMMMFNNNMVEDNMSYTTPPIYPYGNRLGLTITIAPTDSIMEMGIMPGYYQQVFRSWQKVH